MVGCLNPYYWVDDHPLTHRPNESSDPSTHERFRNDDILPVSFPMVFVFFFDGDSFKFY